MSSARSYDRTRLEVLTTITTIEKKLSMMMTTLCPPRTRARALFIPAVSSGNQI